MSAALAACLVAAACGAEHGSRRTPLPAFADARGKTRPQVVSDADAAKELQAIVGQSCSEGAAAGAEPYGMRHVAVDAAGYWQSTGLFLRAGETATLTATGAWTIWQGETAPFGPAGDARLSMFDGCRKGALVARVGLSEASPRLCIGAAARLVAPRDGIVYLAMNDDGSPSYHAGKLDVTVASEGFPAPEVPAAAARAFDYCGVRSGWVELASQRHVLLTVPAALADAERATIPEALAWLDRLYELFTDLAGGTAPFEGQRIRLTPDFQIRGRGWMLAGNPFLYDPKNLNAAQPSRMRLLRLGSDDSDAFDLARALGVAFSRARGARFQVDDAATQAWGGIFALYARQAEVAAGGPTLLAPPESPCAGAAEHAATGTFAAFSRDHELQLCFLFGLQESGGWDVFKRFFAGLPNRQAMEAELPAPVTAEAAWRWLSGRLDPDGEAASLLKAFHVPAD